VPLLKGGGGFHSSGRSYGRSGSSTTQPIGDAAGPLLVIGGIAAVVAFGLWRVSKAGADEDLDFCYSVSAVAPKAGKTTRLLEYLARKDTSVDPKALQKVAESTFRQLQSCWEHRQYDPMRPLMMGHLYAEHLSQIDAMRRHHEINVIANLLVEGVDLVGVHYTHDPEQRSFTALITARARDYYVDDRTSAFLRGDSNSARFQEFWTFQFQTGNWLLREIEQTRESGILKQENIVETVSPEQLREIYDTDAKRPAPAGPWREKSTDLKASRVDQTLDALVKRDPMWNRQEMILRVRKTFMDVMQSQERGNLQGLPADELLPEAAAELAREMQENESQGVTLEYRNLCLRNVDLILVRDKPQPEFTARIGAHTQVIKRKNGAIFAEQEYVTPFQTYWSFARAEGQWRLKDMRPQA
jgi:predicted lipid-binding transport protein (Tim44 family)